MGWERRGKQSYYYHSQRVGDRVVKRYIGKGPMAELFALQMQERQEAQARERDAIHQAEARLAGPDEAAARMTDSTPAPVNFPSTPSTPAADSPADRPIAPAKAPDEAVGRVRELLTARETGDLSGEAELFSLLDQHPTLWLQLGNLTEHAIESWLSLIAGQNLVLRQAIRHRLNHFRSSVAVNCVDPITQLALDRVLVTWLQVTYADSRVAQASNLGEKSQEFLHRRQTAAQRQHLAALRGWRQWNQDPAIVAQPRPERSSEPTVDDPPEDDIAEWILPFPGSRAAMA